MNGASRLLADITSDSANNRLANESNQNLCLIPTPVAQGE